MSAMTRSIAVRASLALLLAIAGAAHAAAAYRAREVLGPVGSPPVWPYAMNNTGSVAGHTDDPNNAFLNDSFILNARRGYAQFQPFGAAYSRTYGINDLGDTVGYAMNSPGDMAFYKPAGKAAIALFPADDTIGSYAWDVNTSGVVTGSFVTADYRQHAFRWEAGVLTELPALGGRFTYAAAINAAGVIAGGSNRVRKSGKHAVKWVNGVLIDLGGLGYTDAYGDGALAINDAGWVAGYCSVANFLTHGCVWHDGVIDELPPLVAGSWSEALDINNSNVAVGRAGYPSSTDRAVIWTNGVISDLNEQVKLPTGVTLGTAQSINDKGQILAYGFDTVQGRVRHFVLIPVATH